MAVRRNGFLVALVAGVLSACGTGSTASAPHTTPSVVDLSGRASVQVEAASRTIACGFMEMDGKASVRCDVQGDWDVSTPAGCHGAYGDSVELGAYTAPHLTCHTDTVFLPHARVIPNGTTVRYAPIVCRFAAGGVTCTNGARERFAVAPKSYNFG